MGVVASAAVMYAGVPVAGATTVASQPISACYSSLRDGRELRLIGLDGRCGKAEEMLVWNRVGITGPRGPRGDAGTQRDEELPGQLSVVVDDDEGGETSGETDLGRVGQIIGSLAWPLVVLILCGLLLLSKRGRELLEKLARRITSIKGGPIAIELSPERSEEVKRNLKDTLESFRHPIIQQFDRWVNVEHVNDLLGKVCTEVVQPALAEGQSFQATIYVKDVLAKDLLYRLVDYYPNGDGRGKVYSVRFGIIGRSWRLQESLCEEVSAEARELITTWGMKWEETVQRAGDAKTFACVMLKNASETTEIGLLFVASEMSGHFDVKQWEDTEQVRALAVAVDNVTRKLAEVAQPPIALFDG